MPGTRATVRCNAAQHDLEHMFPSASAMRDNVSMPDLANDIRLTRGEIRKLVYQWIGVDGGYLVGFSYARHDEFWLEVCDVAISTSDFLGTTRECFEATLFGASVAHQAAVLRAILDRYPPEAIDQGSKPRPSKLHSEILQWLARLETGQATVAIRIASATDIVRRALDDSDALLRASGPQSAVDRVHTAFHGYLLDLASEAGVTGLPDRPTMGQLFKALRNYHPALAPTGPNADDISRVYQAMATIIDALNPLRNNASVAHPNLTLIAEPEAVLVINTVRSLLSYLEAKRRLAGADTTAPAIR